MSRIQLSSKEIKKLNQALSELEAIQDDVERARNAGVPNMDEFNEKCGHCRERIVKLKEQFGSNKP